MPLSYSTKLPCMNTYDSKHLRLLNLIQSRRWSNIGDAEIQELRVLIACKYVAVSATAGATPNIELNPEGLHYQRHLSELERRKAELESVQAQRTHPSYQALA